MQPASTIVRPASTPVLIRPASTHGGRERATDVVSSGSGSAAVFAKIEAGAFRWKGAQRGGVSSNDSRADQSQRHRSFLLNGMRTIQKEQALQLKRTMASSYARKLLESRDEELSLPLPLRRFGTKLMVRLLHHEFDRKAPEGERVTQRIVVMASSLRPTKFEALDDWVRVCLGLQRPGMGSELTGSRSGGPWYLYVTLNGRLVALNTKSAVHEWLDTMWHVHPPTLHVYSSKSLLMKAHAQASTVYSIYNAYSSRGGSSGGGGVRLKGAGSRVGLGSAESGMSLIELTKMVLDMDLPSLGLSQEHVAALISDEFERVDVRALAAAPSETKCQHCQHCQHCPCCQYCQLPDPCLPCATSTPHAGG